MRYVSLTKEQSKKIDNKHIGYTSGKKDPKTGKREEIRFCSNIAFVSVFGYDIEANFITI